MFTGIIEEVGEIVEFDDAPAFRTLRVRAAKVMEGLALGSSIAVNGVCLTVTSFKSDSFTAELSRETLDCTTLDDLTRGTVVNLERPMRADSRFGGHIVQGHVDGEGRIRQFDRQGDNWNLVIEFPEGANRYIVAKGSIAVDGISLTVASLFDDTAFSVAIIPHTIDNTNLHVAKPGNSVNLEYDVIAKYVENLLKPYAIRND